MIPKGKGDFGPGYLAKNLNCLKLAQVFYTIPWWWMCNLNSLEQTLQVLT